VTPIGDRRQWGRRSTDRSDDQQGAGGGNPS
jgi:hypothetical protein